MAKLTNKQLGYIVDEIYNKVSKPIIEENKKALKAVKLDPKDEYLKDCEQYEGLNEQINSLKKVKESLENKWRRETYKDYNFGTYWCNAMSRRKAYEDFQRERSVELKKYPSKTDIERECVLYGNNDIPKMVKELVKKFKNG